MSAWIIETLVATTLLLLAVLLLRSPVSRTLGPRLAYLLWLAPALRMVLPPLPETVLPTAVPGPDELVVVLGGTSSHITDTTAVTGSPDLAMLALAVWLVGAAFFFSRHLIAYRRFAHALRAEADPMPVEGTIAVSRSAAVSSPVAFGILGKTIVVPADFANRFDDTEQRLALAHETWHHRRGDMLANLAALVMLALHWWNPVAHFAYRAFRLDQEAACDDLVLAGASREERAAYGSALFKSATGGMPLFVCAMGSTSQLKDRLRRIVSRPNAGAATRLGFGMTTLLVGAGVFVTASGTGLVSEPLIAETPRLIALNGVTIEPLVHEAPARANPAKVLRAAPERRVAIIKIGTPVPPDAPSAPAPPAAPKMAASAPNGPTDKMVQAKCDRGLSFALSQALLVGDADAPKSVTIVMCRHQDSRMAMADERMVATLRQLRAELEKDPMLEGVRDQLLDSLDRQIGTLSPKPQSRPHYPAG